MYSRNKEGAISGQRAVFPARNREEMAKGLG